MRARIGHVAAFEIQFRNDSKIALETWSIALVLLAVACLKFGYASGSGSGRRDGRRTCSRNRVITNGTWICGTERDAVNNVCFHSLVQANPVMTPGITIGVGGLCRY